MGLINVIAAKSNYIDHRLWLPIKIHAHDTAGIIERLFNHWLPEKEKELITVSLSENADRDSAETTALNFCRLVALLHDIGKITPAFQGKIARAIEGQTDRLSEAGLSVMKNDKFSHAAAGQMICEVELKLPKGLSEIVGFHHGGSPQERKKYNLQAYSADYYGKNEKERWIKLRRDWLEYSLNETGFGSADEIPEPKLNVRVIIAALLIMSDWIASNIEYFDCISVDDDADNIDLDRRVSAAWEKLGLFEPWTPKPFYNCNDYFSSRFGFEANSVQNGFFKILSKSSGKGLYILEAPMGVGKTEAALCAAEYLAASLGLGGIYFGLPTQATANGIFERFLKWAEKCGDEHCSIRLAHGMAELNDKYRELFHGTANDLGDEDEAGVFVHEWFEGRKQALLADFVVATVDQFLLASLKQKHFMLRHLGLAGKVVIIDECHAYDAYMNVYLDSTLAWMGEYGVPVIIMSATLPPKRRNELVKAYFKSEKDIAVEGNASPCAYPVLTHTCGREKALRQAISCDEERHEVDVVKIHDEDIVPLLSKKLANGGCAGVIVNEVQRAQELAKEIERALPEYKVVCFHSRFIATDRAEIEKRLLTCVGKGSDKSMRNGLIVVGTQVIEQSLDLDFDYMITDLCPMDLLLQRSGRLHRHDRPRPKSLECAELAVNIIEKNHVYINCILERTEKLLPDKLTIPRDIPVLVSEVYNEDELGKCEEYARLLSDKKEKAKKYCIPANVLKSKRASLSKLMINGAENSMEAEASVRDSDETIETLVLRKNSETEYALMSGRQTFDPTLPLDNDEGMLIARERIRLPAYFTRYRYNKTVDDLNNMPQMWENSKWLKRELLLLLDKNGEAEVAGIKLKYDKKYGLERLNKEE